ncbi:MAG: sigma-70 family RNA polymerase sigma factor [Aureliella sp.]
MKDVTAILAAIDRGDMSPADKLLPLVYEELRKLAKARLAKEKSGQTLQPTALVHEAYLRLVDSDQSQRFDSRGHFFAAAAEAMRRILVDRARLKARPKHGGDLKRVDLEPTDAVRESPSEELLAINEALERFEEIDPEKSQLVKLRYFVGMTLIEAADAMGISRATASRHWTFAKAWIANELSPPD